MKLRRLQLRGFGPFRDEVSLDLEALPGTLVAVVGENGAGKSTLLEAWPGALYRRTPTRGSLADLAVERAAVVEVEIAGPGGAAWTIRQTVDGVSGKGEALVLAADGRPVVSGRKRSEEWVRTRLPSPEVFFASVFGVQGAGGFLAASPGERKAILLRALGCERLEALAERCQKRASDARARLSTAEARVRDERARSGDPTAVEAALKAAREEAARTTVALEEARQARAAAAQEEAAVRDARAAREEALRWHRQARAQLEAARGEAARAARDLQALEAALADAPAIRAAAERLAELGGAAAELRTEMARLDGGASAARREATAAAGRARGARERAARATAQLEQSRRGLPAGVDLAAAEAALAVAREAVAAAQAEEARVVDVAAVGAEGRIGALRGGLQRIAAGECEPRAEAQTTLEHDDLAEAEAAAAPERLQAARASGRRAVEEERRAAALVDALRRAAELEPAARAAAEETAAAEADAEGAAARAAAEETAAATCAGVLALLALCAAASMPLASRASDLARAEVLAPEARARAARAQEEATLAEHALEELPEPTIPPPAPDLAAAEEAVLLAEVAARRAAAALAVAERQAEVVNAAAGRLATLEDELRAAGEDLADWTRLAEDLGRDGLQALEIDAAGPELTELANDLLRTCVGARWSVAIETTRLSADGRRELEDCEVRVYDGERGRVGAADTFSGGERVLLGEAVALALAMVAARRAGLEGLTLIRDESGAALDPKNAPAYVAMLRRAAEIVGASKVLFVSHNPDTWALADARIVVRDGYVEVDGQVGPRLRRVE